MLHVIKLSMKNMQNAWHLNMAFKEFRSKFLEKRNWCVDNAKVPESDPLKQHFENNTWPTVEQIQDYGNHWHILPLTRCNGQLNIYE